MKGYGDTNSAYRKNRIPMKPIITTCNTNPIIVHPLSQCCYYITRVFAPDVKGSFKIYIVIKEQDIICDTYTSQFKQNYFFSIF